MLVDIILVLVITISIIHCFKRGFAISLFNTASTVIAAVLIILFNKPFTQLIKNSPLGISYHQGLLEFVSNKVHQTGNNITEGVPSFLGGFIDEGVASVGQTVAKFADRIFEITVTLIAFVLLVIVAKIITSIFPVIIKKIVKLPVIKQFDKLLGAVLGIVMGVVWAVVAVYVLGLVSLWEPMSFLDAHIANSFFIDAVHRFYDILAEGELIAHRFSYTYFS